MRQPPVGKLSRRLGLALTEKAGRVLDNRPYAPGQHGPARRNKSPYQERLIEKQRLRFQYHVSEAQLRRAFESARTRPGLTGHELIEDLETRLDAMVLRSGIAKTIYQARQFVVHRHILVNGRRLDRPSARIQPGDVISVAPRSRSMTPFIVSAAQPNSTPPPYLDVNPIAMAAVLVRRPTRAEIPVVCDEQLVVEYYAR